MSTSIPAAVSMSGPSPLSRRWVFTLNNPTDDEEQRLGDTFGAGQPFRYAVFGREVGESGTPHLQGFFILTSPKRRSWLSRTILGRLHLEPARGTSTQAADYCKKDGNYDEFGELPTEQGRRTDVERLREFIIEHPTRPTAREITRNFFGLSLRYGNRIEQLIDHLRPETRLVPDDAILRNWQTDLYDFLGSDPDDRSITFYVDEDGNSGKSWFCRYWLTNFFAETQILSIGKRDDLTFALDPTKKYFLFDVPRNNMEFLQYSVLESIKDQIIFCNKYQSKTKVLPAPVHVVVFSNEMPDMNAMTQDRYIIKRI